MSEINESLLLQIKEHEKDGCQRACRSLGFAKMPAGYALMLNTDISHFYWLRHDGVESVISWNKWQVRKWAKQDNAINTSQKRV